ncbi:MAG: restriction endonuclease, partial [Acinetobacter sp.]
MAAKKLAIAFCAFSFLQTSFAGFERFWIFSKDADTQVNETWDSLSDTEQAALIKRYQSLKEIPAEQSVSLQ